MREQSEDKARVPLKTILQNFLNHVDYLESRKRGRDDAYEQEFQVRPLSKKSSLKLLIIYEVN
jgi:hypothetical protein